MPASEGALAVIVTVRSFLRCVPSSGRCDIDMRGGFVDSVYVVGPELHVKRADVLERAEPGVDRHDP